LNLQLSLFFSSVVLASIGGFFVVDYTLRKFHIPQLEKLKKHEQYLGSLGRLFVFLTFILNFQALIMVWVAAEVVYHRKDTALISVERLQLMFISMLTSLTWTLAVFQLFRYLEILV